MRAMRRGQNVVKNKFMMFNEETLNAKQQLVSCGAEQSLGGEQI